jgi:hypothetical protein
MTGIFCSDACIYQKEGFCGFDEIDETNDLSGLGHKKCAYYKSKAHSDKFVMPIY